MFGSISDLVKFVYIKEVKYKMQNLVFALIDNIN